MVEPVKGKRRKPAKDKRRQPAKDKRRKPGPAEDKGKEKEDADG